MLTCHHRTARAAATTTLALSLLLVGIAPDATGAGGPGGTGGAGSLTCDGRAATIVFGPDAHGRVAGTDGDDVIVVEPDASISVVDAKEGDDVVCVLQTAASPTTNKVEMVGSDGKDRLDAGASPQAVISSGGNGDDVLVGSPHDDSLDGDTGDDTLVGGPGDDQISTGAGIDTAEGGLGTDTWIASGNRSDVHAYTIDVPAHTISGKGRDAIKDLEVYYGSLGADTFVGGSGADTFVGLQGDDVMRGHAGPDLLYGDQGRDTLVGGSGHDLANGGPNFPDVCEAEVVKNC